MNDNDQDFPIPEPNEAQMHSIAKSYALRQLYWPAYTWDIQTKQLNQIDELKPKIEDKGIEYEGFLKKKADIFEKINASFYHLCRIESNENKIIEVGKEYAEAVDRTKLGGMGVILGTPYEPITYEYEAMLVTLKTALDILAMILAETLSSKADNIGSLVNEVSLTKSTKPVVVKLKKLFINEKHAATLAEFKNSESVKSKRNYAVHQGALPTATINIRMGALTEINVLKTRTMKVDGTMESLTQQESLVDYTKGMFYAVCDLIVDALSLVTEKDIESGKKSSVYETRIKKSTD